MFCVIFCSLTIICWLHLFLIQVNGVCLWHFIIREYDELYAHLCFKLKLPVVYTFTNKVKDYVEYFNEFFMVCFDNLIRFEQMETLEAKRKFPLDFLDWKEVGWFYLWGCYRFYLLGGLSFARIKCFCPFENLSFLKALTCLLLLKEWPFVSVNS